MLNSSLKWPKGSQELAIQLHSKLKLDNKNWHELKNNPERRAAELISGAIVQLISEGNPNDVLNLLTQSEKWIKGEIKAPRCPQH